LNSGTVLGHWLGVYHTGKCGCGLTNYGWPFSVLILFFSWWMIICEITIGPELEIQAKILEN